jgi:hypothetical protein
MHSPSLIDLLVPGVSKAKTCSCRARVLYCTSDVSHFDSPGAQVRLKIFIILKTDIPVVKIIIIKDGA